MSSVAKIEGYLRGGMMPDRICLPVGISQSDLKNNPFSYLDGTHFDGFGNIEQVINLAEQASSWYRRKFPFQFFFNCSEGDCNGRCQPRSFSERREFGRGVNLRIKSGSRWGLFCSEDTYHESWLVTEMDIDYARQGEGIPNFGGGMNDGVGLLIYPQGREARLDFENRQREFISSYCRVVGAIKNPLTLKICDIGVNKDFYFNLDDICRVSRAKNGLKGEYVRTGIVELLDNLKYFNREGYQKEASSVEIISGKGRREHVFRSRGREWSEDFLGIVSTMYGAYSRDFVESIYGFRAELVSMVDYLQNRMGLVEERGAREVIYGVMGSWYLSLLREWNRMTNSVEDIQRWPQIRLDQKTWRIPNLSVRRG